MATKTIYILSDDVLHPKRYNELSSSEVEVRVVPKPQDIEIEINEKHQPDNSSEVVVFVWLMSHSFDGWAESLQLRDQFSEIRVILVAHTLLPDIVRRATLRHMHALDRTKFEELLTLLAQKELPALPKWNPSSLS